MTAHVPVVSLQETHLSRYLRATSAPSYSLLFLLPLILVYECLAVCINVHHTLEVRNGADVVLQEVLHLLSMDNLPLALVLLTLVIVGALATHLRRGVRLRAAYFGAMVVESCVWAWVLGTISRGMVGLFLSRPSIPIADGTWTQVMLYLGAGVYEELVFRVILISMFLYVLRHCFDLEAGTAVLASIVIAAVMFSGFHHLGILGEPFVGSVFLFRFFAGLVLSVLYVSRGFGITAWAHTLYDLFNLFGWM